MTASTIATICARGGSKGLPGKNVRVFAGKPLIVHSIEQALACAAIAEVFVSTDDAAIAAVARAAGATVPFLRPAELATDRAGKLPVIEHLVAFLQVQGRSVARIVDLQPTSPLREAGDISAALAARPEADLVVSVAAARDNPYFNLVEAQPDGWVTLSKGAGQGRRQDAPQVYALNGSIYVWQRQALAHAARHGLWSVRVAPFVMPRWKSADIDDLEDFEYAQWLHARHAPGGQGDGG
ncbi:MAG: CMP-N,N-diacetyllegionaminic acid synthase [Ramlibacter sp.]|jgi:CMP-N,N'-diacetyllegionaminic acid synthase|uniref:acylneuraminate cytidylyltransferase family protein n=1 Tax=Ramlibacter sp. TaxID=1917967 RepID=UPI002639C343|nr:acylneuraminate cytidylyltransferase family protein [Ramlibacter sp.]MDB5752805.1 CMP-N,N-diacetyllegionaminic acid synthase [Ramlibacter sp.]